MLKLPLLELLVLAALSGTLCAQPPQGTTALIFDKSCDGLTLIVTGDKINGTHDNWDCKGSVAPIGGIVSTVSRVKPAGLRGVVEAVISDQAMQGFAGCPANYYLRFDTNQWAAYSSCDGSSPQSLLNRGTFTIITNSATSQTRGGVASFREYSGADDSDPVADAAYPRGPYTLTFDGYCTIVYI